MNELTHFFGKNENMPISFYEVEVIPIPEYERGEIIHKLIREVWNIEFCVYETIEMPLPTATIVIYIFAHADGMCFGMVDGFGDVKDDYNKVVCITGRKKFGIIANGLIEFFNLCNYYPHWRDIVAAMEAKEAYTLEELEKNPLYLTDERDAKKLEIARLINLKEDTQSISKMLNCLNMPSEFEMYSSDRKEQYSTIAYMK